MNKIISTAILLMIHVLGYSQWYPVNLHADSKEAMFVTNEDSVYFTTTNGGRIHLECPNASFFQTPFATEWFLDIDFPSKSVGYACGGTNFGSYTNIVLKTVDAGATWDSITANHFNGYSLTDIDFLNIDTGFVSGDVGLLRTTDGGQSFSQIPLPTNTSRITELHCTNDKLILASEKLLDNSTSTYLYTINISNDLGSSWSEVYVDTMIAANGLSNRRINSIQFLNNHIGFAVGGNGLFLKTTNGGTTWQKDFVSPYSKLSTVWFTSENIGYINNVGGIFQTTDGGMNWNAQNISPPIVVNQIQFANDSVGYALGGGGLYKTTNGGSSQTASIAELLSKKTVRVFPNPTNHLLQIDVSEDLKIESSALFDISGVKVKEFNKDDRVVNVQDVFSGTYILKLETKDRILIEKVLIE